VVVGLVEGELDRLLVNDLILFTLSLRKKEFAIFVKLRVSGRVLYLGFALCLIENHYVPFSCKNKLYPVLILVCSL
jgi:hypothetical protein